MRRKMSEQDLVTEQEVANVTSVQFSDEAWEDVQRALKVQRAHTIQRFKDAVKQSQKGEEIDLSEEEFEVFYSIYNAGIAEAHKSRVCPEPRCKGKGGWMASSHSKWVTCPTCQGTGEVQKARPDREKIFSIPALLAAAEEGRQEGRLNFIKWLRGTTKYKLMQRTSNGKYYENLLEGDWQTLKDGKDD